MQTKIDKWDRIKLKNTCTENETINKKKKKKPSEWEKATDKGLTSKIYKQFMQLNIRKTKNPIKKMGRTPKQTFLQRKPTDG